MTDEIRAALDGLQTDMIEILDDQDTKHREVIETLNMLAQLMAEGQQREQRQIDNLWNVFQGLSEEIAGLRQILVRVSENQRAQEDSLNHVSDQIMETDVNVTLATMDVGIVLARIKTVERALAVLLLFRTGGIVAAVAG